MPGAALPVRPTRYLSDPTMVSTPATPGAAREFTVGQFTLQGPHGGGGVRVSVSQNHAACTKLVYFRTYKDGVLISTDLMTLTTDSSAGIEQTYAIAIPPDFDARSAAYRVTWAADCNSSLYSALRTVYVAPVNPKVLPAPVFRRMLNHPMGHPWQPVPTVTGNRPVLSQAPGGGLRMRFPTANKVFAGVGWALPIRGSFTATALVRTVPGGSNFDIRGGMTIFTPGAKGHVIGPFRFDQQVGMIGVTTTSLTADWSGYDSYFGLAGATSRCHPDRACLTWFRARWDAAAGSLTSEWSGDKRTWTTMFIRGGLADQPTHVGAGQYVNSAASNVDTAFDLVSLEVVPGSAA